MGADNPVGEAVVVVARAGGRVAVVARMVAVMGARAGVGPAAGAGARAVAVEGPAGAGWGVRVAAGGVRVGRWRSVGGGVGGARRRSFRSPGFG